MNRGDGYCKGAFAAHLAKWRLIAPRPAPAPTALPQVAPGPAAVLFDETFERFHHADLDYLSDKEIWRELRQIEHVLAWDDRADTWLVERHRALVAEQRRRRAK